MTHASLQSNAAFLLHVSIRLFIALARRNMRQIPRVRRLIGAMDSNNPTVAAQKRRDKREILYRHGQLLSVSVEALMRPLLINLSSNSDGNRATSARRGCKRNLSADGANGTTERH